MSVKMLFFINEDNIKIEECMVKIVDYMKFI